MAVYYGTENNLIILKKRGFFGVKPDGACSSDWDTKGFYFLKIIYIDPLFALMFYFP